MKSEFEEKEFESPLYSELRSGSPNIMTPGQVFEANFGIDAALLAINPLFWEMFGFRDIPAGIALHDFSWGFVWRRAGHKRILPKFETNLLVQAKRSTPLARVNRDLKKLGFRAPFWRFNITYHQQEILEKVAKKLQRKALVVYAAPAFHKLDDLYYHTRNISIVKNTSFVKISKLSGHKQWNFDKPGTTGVAHSEIELIEDIPFDSMIEEILSYAYDETDAASNLAYLHKSAEEVCRELQGQNPVARYYLNRSRFLEEIPTTTPFRALKHYLSFNLFCQTLKASWLVPK